MSRYCERRVTILLVEDDEFVRAVTHQILCGAGFEVLCARDAIEALELARCHKGRIEVLFSDVVMPGKTGPELGMELRRERPDIKLLFTSGYGDTADEVTGCESDGEFFLPKPFSVGTLVKKVNEVLTKEFKSLAAGAG